MPLTTNEEQFKFLISCIRWSNNGKVDFTEVAKECKIVSKGAAAKRYERMMKAHGIAPNTTSARSNAPARNAKAEHQEANTRPSKKQKIVEAFTDDCGAIEDDQEVWGLAGYIKPEPATRAEELRIKEESGMMHAENGQHIMQLSTTLDETENSYNNITDIIETGPGSYSTVDIDGHMYPLQEQPEFMTYADFGSSPAGAPMPVIRQVCGNQDSIVIGDEEI